MTLTDTKTPKKMDAKTKLTALAVTAVAVGALSAQAIAASNSVKITETGGQRCMTSNGIPDHQTGRFPNSGNPNSIAIQNIKLCVTASPTKGTRAKNVNGTVGFALNGIILRPGTADWYDASSSRGHSRDRSSGWNLEGLGARETLGMDSNNAHVDNQGIYHYHGPSDAIMKAAQGTLIGYAADGHEIHYMGSKVTSSWQLKSGTRSSAPGGAHDGTYNQDWQYVAKSGNLDKCNGGTMNGKYVYFATDTYPFFPRCNYGTVSSDFERRGADRSQQGGQQHGQKGEPKQGQRNQQANLRGNNRQQGNQNGRRNGPPQFALAACQTKSVGNSCSMTTPRGKVSGQCVLTPDQQTACRPQRR